MMLTPVILCGGSGTRLWPLSRSHMPKQLLAVHDEATMLQATARRLARFDSATVSAPVVVCNDAHRFVTRRQLQEIGEAHAELIAEPAGRNTAPALTLAALHAQHALAGQAGGNDPILLVMPADHVIADLDAFQRAVAIALRVLANNSAAEAIVTFGIVPTEPATGYGYLKVGATSGFDPGAFALDSFVEKPPLERAREYVADGRFLWNSGLFVVRASVWLRALRELEPAMLAACEAALDAAQRADHDVLPSPGAFAACPANSIDYAVMEKLAVTPGLGIRGVVVPLDAGWSDIGAWDSAWAIAAKDERGNAALGEAIFEQSNNTYVRTTGPNAPVVACVGIDDAVIVHTPDAILVASKSRAQDVKQVTAALAARSDRRAELHRRVERPWGWYDSLGSAPRSEGALAFQVKHLGVLPGQAISLQLHHHRSEHWVVIKGEATITLGDDVATYRAGQHVHIPVGTVHRLANQTQEAVELIEVQLGSYLGEDDIVRLDDRYQRR
ncbi:MAG: mannose-1-phosphate guanylyltransferase/mannose-6-phosphate isomerase [Burkholderiales bacterium]|nr:mannose-1-phosphate guanylyltransferase/mannose-6-phosphate isomerase [Pseudomonadota bacterium]MCC7068206.1 mannose-1-phosphate guanylyltransferase/mannose-6-phosphate isomerase [Burkholderiales bacterium]MCZ2134857.1 mannose-1-phosphate guanylyltransferase/mannose-6-phosphate isomerase [Burkholderiales bacterium]